jgi:hypothetical protein
MEASTLDLPLKITSGESLDESELYARIKTRAYYRYVEECRRAKTEVSDRNLAHWEGAVRDEYRDRISVRAYHLWKAECHRVGGVVHKNDHYHWFEAVIIEEQVFPPPLLAVVRKL